MRWQIPQDVVHRGDGFLLVAVSMSPCAERRWRRFGLDWFGFWISSRRISMTPLLLRAERAWQKIWPPPSHCIHFTFSANFARTETGKPIWLASFSDHIFQFNSSCLGFPAWISSTVKGYYRQFGLKSWEIAWEKYSRRSTPKIPISKWKVRVVNYSLPSIALCVKQWA